MRKSTVPFLTSVPSTYGRATITPDTCARTSTLLEAAACATHSNLAGTTCCRIVRTVTSGGGGPAGAGLRHAAKATSRATRLSDDTRLLAPRLPGARIRGAIVQLLTSTSWM